MSTSRGTILAFIDADCIADGGWISTIAEEFAGRAERQIIGGDVRIAIRDPQRPTLLECYESVFAYRQKEYIERHGYSGTGNMAVRRSYLPICGSLSLEWTWLRILIGV